jgi:hypothetical protein
MGFMNRFQSALQHGWNAFTNRDPTPVYRNGGYGYSNRPDRPRLTRGNERSIITAIYNRIALDVAKADIFHCRLDDEDRFTEVITSDLNNCLTLEANIDQTAFAFKQDVVLSMFDEGVVSILPVETSSNPDESGNYKIYSMRTAKVTQWHSQHVEIRAYNELTGKQQDIVRTKKSVAIIENPFYAVMNEPNSVMQRLIRKLNILDAIDEQSGSGKMDLIIQLPYVVKSQSRRDQAEARRKDIEMQLTNSKYGIAYIDGTERVTQLNRPVENNLMKQIEYLTSMLYSQLGIHQSVLDGTADEKTMNNYQRRIVAVVVTAIVDEMKRKFLTKTARTQKQSIMWFIDPFEFIPASEVATMGDALVRNEIFSKNEIRQLLGRKPSKDPSADQLSNPNISKPAGPQQHKTEEVIEDPKEGGENQNG